jgi:hypothetical protein
MRLRVALDVSIGLHEGQDFGGFCMSDWSREAANKLHKRAERKSSENAALTEKRRLMEEQGPGLWQQLCLQVKKLCDELNADYKEDIATVKASSANDLNVELRHVGNMSELNVKFTTSTSADALRWSYAGPAARVGRGGQRSLSVDAGRIVFQDTLTPSTLESIATQMLDGLLHE